MPPRPAIIDKQAAGRLAIVRDYLGKKYKKLSQGEIAVKCETTQSSISKMERGDIDIPQHVLKGLFIHFNINPNYIIIGKDCTIEFKKETKTLVTDTRELRAEIEILSANMRKMQEDIRIISQGKTVTKP